MAAKQIPATPAAQSAVGNSAAEVATKSGDAETAVSSSDGNSHQSWPRDARDFQTKAFDKMVSKAMRKLGRTGGTSSVLELQGVSVKRHV